MVATTEIIRCFICQRQLRGLRARSLGIGPVCARKRPDLVRHRLVERAGQQRLPFYKDAATEPQETWEDGA